MVVKDFMTPNPITVFPDTTFSEALRIMRERKIRRLPVLEGGKLVGIVTEKDLLYASPSKATTLDIWELHYVLSKLKVGEIMTKNVITVEESAPLEEAARIMAENKIGALPVLNEEGELVGIITETDIFKVFIDMLGARRDGIRYTFTAPNKPGIILEISKRIYDAGGNIIAVSSYPKDGMNYFIVMKVAGVDHERFVKSLEGCEAKLEYFHK